MNAMMFMGMNFHFTMIYDKTTSFSLARHFDFPLVYVVTQPCEANLADVTIDTSTFLTDGYIRENIKRGLTEYCNFKLLRM